MIAKKVVVSIFLIICVFSLSEAKKRSKKSLLSVSTTPPASITGLNYELEVDTRTNIDKLSDGDPLVRRRAAILLGREKKAGNIRHLVNMLNDKNPLVRRTAVKSLVRSCSTRAAKMKAVRVILGHFDSEKDIGVTIDCVKALGELGLKKAVPKLKLLLKHPHPLVRAYAVRSLGEIADVGTYPLFVKMLVNETESVCIQSAKVVAKLKIKAAVPNLLTSLKHPENKVRRAAVDALGEVGDAGVLPVLEGILDDEDKYMVRKAKVSIEKIKKRFPKTKTPLKK
jgi:HEAT repeat protein